MAEAVVLDSSTASFPFGRSHSDVIMKRKTPSELRGEQLKRKAVESKRVAGVFSTMYSSEKVGNGILNGDAKPQTSKVPRYIDTRVNDVFPVKKSTERCRMILGRNKAFPIAKEVSNNFVGPCSVSLLADDQSADSVCNEEILDKPKDSMPSTAKDVNNQVFPKIEKCSQSSLRNVVHLHLGNENLADSAKVDMEKALKGFVARDIPVISGPFSIASGQHSSLPSFAARNSSLKFEIPGYRAPLDLTLKTSVRFVLSSPVKWCHRLSACPASIDLSCFVSQSSPTKSQSGDCTTGVKVPNEVLFSEALQSWVYPQSSLPSSIISIMESSSVKGESDFLLKRQQEWEDSFQNLYYMLRRNLCNIYYVYAPQFVVLFVGGNFSETKKHTCSAYLSSSTRSLRSLLRKHEIKFEMPLCFSETVQANEDELVELSEIEKQNLGQAYHLDSSSEIDNTPQSVLSFVGNENVHCLYDFLLNYRSFLSSSSGYDVPVLYAPSPFQNASLHVPEVVSKEIRRAEALIVSSRESETDENEALSASSSNHICYSIEIKDTVLPPWVVSRLCAALSSDHRSFEANFINESTSVGLNIALDNVCQKPDMSTESNKLFSVTANAYGIAEATATPLLRSSSLRHLKFFDGAYVASLIPL